MNGRVAAIPVSGSFRKEKNSLHLPFYQTNTSQYCPQYAACVKGSRGAQVPVRECPGFAKSRCFCIRSICGWWGGIIRCLGVEFGCVAENGRDAGTVWDESGGGEIWCRRILSLGLGR